MTVSVSQGYSGSCPSSWSLPRRQPQVSRSCNVPSPGPGNHWLTSDSQVLPLTPSLSPPTSCFCGPACYPASGPGLDVSLDCVHPVTEPWCLPAARAWGALLGQPCPCSGSASRSSCLPPGGWAVANMVWQGPISGVLAATLCSGALEISHLSGGNTFLGNQNWLHAVTHHSCQGSCSDSE